MRPATIGGAELFQRLPVHALSLYTTLEEKLHSLTGDRLLKAQITVVKEYTTFSSCLSQFQSLTSASLTTLSPPCTSLSAFQWLLSSQDSNTNRLYLTPLLSLLGEIVPLSHYEAYWYCHCKNPL